MSLQHSYNNFSKDEMEKKVRELMQDIQSVNIAPEYKSIIEQECAKALSGNPGTDTVIWFDVSGSMGGPGKCEWDAQTSIISGIVPTAQEYDRDGITLIPIYTPSPFDKDQDTRKDNVRTKDEAMGYVNQFASQLKARTPTRTCFKRDVEAHVQKCVQDPETKRLNGVVITDGLPTDFQTQTMTQTIEWAILELYSKDLDPKRYMGLSYVIVTDNLDTMAGFRKLDERKMWGSNVECDITNAMYPFSIQALGGANAQVVIDIILAANHSDACDEAVDCLQSGKSKDILDIIDAYVHGGFAREV